MYNFTTENRNFFMTAGEEILRQYGHETDYNGMNTIWDVYAQNKANVAEILSKHPNWDPEIMAIHLTEEYNTSVDTTKVEAFAAFLFNRLKAWCENREIKYGNMTWEEADKASDRLIEMINFADRAPSAYQPVRFAGRTRDELAEDLNRIQRIKRRFYFNTEHLYDITISNDDFRKGTGIREVIRTIKSKTENTLDEYFASLLNEVAIPFFPLDKEGKRIVKVRFATGQKTSKAISKFFSLVGEEFVGYKQMETVQWTDQSGNSHEREKDMGWNGKFSAYGDGINPIKVKRHTYLSINPLDYLTMSFGNGWSSCHTIDHENTRPNNGSHTYHGCYQSGTLSYMLDGASIVMYTTREDIDESRPWAMDKINRCMFHLGKEKFVQGRTYPDGRDNPNNEEAATIASCFRNIFQRVISECWNVSNMWTIRRNNSHYTTSFGTHYRDYLTYNDTCTSLLKGSTNEDTVHIGHNPICPVCGVEHGREDSLHCGDDHECVNDDSHVECASCSRMIRAEEAIYDPDRERYYCDGECANNEGCYYCENDGEWHSLNVFYDDYEDVYFYDPDDERIEVNNGVWVFRNEENAIEYGFIQDENGNWVRDN